MRESLNICKNDNDNHIYTPRLAENGLVEDKSNRDDFESDIITNQALIVARTLHKIVINTYTKTENHVKITREKIYSCKKEGDIHF